MNDETGGVATEEFVGLKPKIYSFLVDNSEHKKAKGVNRNVNATSHNEYKDVLLNNKSIKYSINRIQSKDHRIGAEHMKSTKLNCLVLMTKHIFKTMDIIE